MLFSKGRAVSLNELTVDTGMSWVTIRKYVNNGIGKGIIVKQANNKSTSYALSPHLLSVLFDRRRSINENK